MWTCKTVSIYLILMASKTFCWWEPLWQTGYSIPLAVIRQPCSVSSKCGQRWQSKCMCCLVSTAIHYIISYYASICSGWTEWVVIQCCMFNSSHTTHYTVSAPRNVVHPFFFYRDGGIGPADPASAGPKFQNYNPKSLFMSSECICIDQLANWWSCNKVPVFVYCFMIV